MSFMEKLRETIAEGKTASGDFKRSWGTCRDAVIYPLFEQAVLVLSHEFSDKGGGGKASLKNGTAVVLYAARTRSGDPEFSLTFESDEVKREVVCSFHPPISPEERYTLDALKESIFEDKILRLARAVAES